CIRAFAGVLPLRDPALCCGEGSHVVEEARTWHPVRAVVEGIDLVVLEAPGLGDAPREGGLAGAGDAGDQHALRAEGKRIFGGEHRKMLPAEYIVAQDGCTGCD